MNAAAILQLLNSSLSLTPAVITLIDQICKDSTVPQDDAGLQALLAQIDTNTAAVNASVAAFKAAHPEIG